MTTTLIKPLVTFYFYLEADRYSDATCSFFAEDENKGFKYRKILYLGVSGKAPKVPNMFLLRHELSSISGALISGIEVKIRLVRASDEKLLMTGKFC